MMTIKTDGIVLRYANYGESNRMLSLLTPEMGLIPVSARGCRNAKSKNLPATELFSTGEYMLHERDGRYSMGSFHLQQNFYAIREDYGKLAHGVYWLNLAEAAAQPGEDAHRLFRMMLLSLAVLCYGEIPHRSLTAVFLMQFAILQGYAPRLDGCVRCGIDTAARFFFDTDAGGICCADCAAYGSDALSGDELAWLREAQAKGAFVLAGQRPQPLAERPETAEGAFRCMKSHVEHRIEKRIISGRFL
ncbi:MAG: DNA repair protein RecO [Clostridia bacterium]|nr:DNA repair protein RecO [Clostridia bacterium]